MTGFASAASIPFGPQTFTNAVLAKTMEIPARILRNSLGFNAKQLPSAAMCFVSRLTAASGMLKFNSSTSIERNKSIAWRSK